MVKNDMRKIRKCQKKQDELRKKLPNKKEG